MVNTSEDRNKFMKICHVINDLSRGGAETHLFSFEACFAIQFSCVSCSLLKVERFFIINLRFFWGPPSTTNADDGIY